RDRVERVAAGGVDPGGFDVPASRVHLETRRGVAHAAARPARGHHHEVAAVRRDVETAHVPGEFGHALGRVGVGAPRRDLGGGAAHVNHADLRAGVAVEGGEAAVDHEPVLGQGQRVRPDLPGGRVAGGDGEVRVGRAGGGVEPGQGGARAGEVAAHVEV